MRSVAIENIVNPSRSYVFSTIKDFMKVLFRFFKLDQQHFFLQRIIYMYTVDIILLKSYLNFYLGT